MDKQAAEEGLSLNQVVKRLLRKALGLSGATIAPPRGFDEFSGLWTKEDAASFRASTERKIDQEDWT